jgi:hypothetical protein
VFVGFDWGFFGCVWCFSFFRVRIRFEASRAVLACAAFFVLFRVSLVWQWGHVLVFWLVLASSSCPHL